ncbi:MAG: hypothetical protein GVY32_11400 [Gammaproteobacteria bacterium]|nr:hypothetical protein [Gammaproteobacteria bacterium]
MLELVDTRIRSGYSRYGPPPVAVYELRAVSDADQSAILEGFEALAGLGLPAPDLGGEPAPSRLARGFAALVSALLERGGHLAGPPVVEGPGKPDGGLVVNLPCEEPETAQKAAELAARLLSAAETSLDDASRALAAFLDFANARMPHPDARRIIGMARSRGLPVLRLDQHPFEFSSQDRPFRAGLFQIGHGAHRRVLAGAVPSLDPGKLIHVASRDRLVARLLRHGLPLPRQDLEFPNKNRATRAARAAERLGGPVAMRAILRRPFAHALGVSPVFEPLATEPQVLAVYEAAAAGTRNVWIEAHVGGDRIRCLIIGGELVAATRGRPPSITGDGRRSVTELIADAVHAAGSPRHRHAWRILQAGDRDLAARLAMVGLRPDSVPDRGWTIGLRGDGTAFNGGALEDVRAALSDPIRRLAERAAAVCGLPELAAVDLAVVDPGGDAAAPNCHVLDVVPDPDLASHVEGRPGCANELHERLVETLFPPDRPARIPTVAITGTNGKTTTSRMTAAILRHAAYQSVGLATTEGAYVDDERIVGGDVAGVTGAAMVLADDRVRAAVLETARGGLHSVGTAMEAVDAAACLNIASDHIGIDGIDSIEQLAAVKARALELADGQAIVNADDPRCLAMLERCPRAQPVLVSRLAASSTVRDHRAAGHRAVLITGADDGREQLLFADGTDSEVLMPTHDIPAVMNGLLPFNALNAAFAAALCWSLGIDTAAIRDGLGGFSNSVEGNPGRYNFIEGRAFTLLTDFAQNAHGLAELYAVVDRLPTAGRKRLVCLTIGSRHREHIDENAADMLDRFDHLIIGCSEYADSNPEYAGDNPRETMLAQFRARLLEAGAAPERFETHADPARAIRRGLETAAPGDLLVILGSPEVVLPELDAREAT